MLLWTRCKNVGILGISDNFKYFSTYSTKKLTKVALILLSLLVTILLKVKRNPEGNIWKSVSFLAVSILIWRLCAFSCCLSFSI